MKQTPKTTDKHWKLIGKIGNTEEQRIFVIQALNENEASDYAAIFHNVSENISIQELPICKKCGVYYDKAGVRSIYGAESMILSGGYCSANCYTLSKPKPAATTPIQEDDKGSLPPHIHRQFIEAAKKYSSNGTENVTVNAPETYKIFRAGQDSAFSILKAQNKSLQIEEDSKHTPGKLDNNLKDGNVYSGGIVVAHCYSSILMPATIKANAARIVECWNNYDALKQANKELLEALKQISYYKGNDSLTGQILKNIANKSIAKHSPKQ